MSTPARSERLVDIGEVSRMLAAQIQSLCLELLPHGKKASHEWMIGSPAGEPGNSMAVHLTGAKAGVWQDFAAGEGGDALDLVAACVCAGDKKDALRWARRWLGIDKGDPAALERARRQVPDTAAINAQAEAEEANARKGAMAIWIAAHADLTGTPVETYLAGRGIHLADLVRMPRAIRFHPELWSKEAGRRFPAMVAAISGPEGFMGVHRTWLERQADGSVTKAPLETAKKVLGPHRGGHIPLARGASGRTLREAPEGEILDISEGIEDGLSVAVSLTDARVVAAITIGNMASIHLPPQIKTVRIWRQNDTKKEPIAAFARAIDAQLRAGREIIIPDIGNEVKDVNDLLRTPPND